MGNIIVANNSAGFIAAGERKYPGNIGIIMIATPTKKDSRYNADIVPVSGKQSQYPLRCSAERQKNMRNT